MTPEQEQILIEAVVRLTHTVQNHEVLIAEIREGQAMLAQYFRESLDRFDERTRAIERRTDEMSTEMQETKQEIRDLRRDFLEFLQK